MQNSACFGRLLPCCLIIAALYASNAQAFHHHCIGQYQPCMQSIEARLLTANSAKEQAKLQLDKAVLMAIYGHFSTAQSLLEHLIDNPHLSQVEAIEAVVYLAKLYFVSGITDKAEQLVTQAEQRIGKVAMQTLDWALLVEYSNILTYNNKLRESWQVLSSLLERPQAGIPHDVLADMYSNLGHLAIRLDRKQLHLEYRRKSFQHALKVNNPQQLGIAAHNLARAFAVNMDYEKAHQMFSKSIAYSLQAGDISSANYSRFRLAEMNFTMGLYPVARKILVNLINSDLSDSPLVPISRAKGLLNEVYDRMFTTY